MNLYRRSRCQTADCAPFTGSQLPPSCWLSLRLSVHQRFHVKNTSGTTYHATTTSTAHDVKHNSRYHCHSAGVRGQATMILQPQNGRHTQDPIADRMPSPCVQPPACVQTSLAVSHRSVQCQREAMMCLTMPAQSCACDKSMQRPAATSLHSPSPTCVVLAGGDDQAADAGDREPDGHLDYGLAAVDRIGQRPIQQKRRVAAE